MIKKAGCQPPSRKARDGIGYGSLGFLMDMPVDGYALLPRCEPETSRKRSVDGNAGAGAQGLISQTIMVNAHSLPGKE